MKNKRVHNIAFGVRTLQLDRIGIELHSLNLCMAVCS